MANNGLVEWLDRTTILDSFPEIKDRNGKNDASDLTTITYIAKFHEARFDIDILQNPAGALFGRDDINSIVPDHTSYLDRPALYI